MTKETAIKLFEEKQVRSIWDAEQEKWYVSIVDVIGILTDSPNPRKYWSLLKTRLKAEGSQLAANCSQLKMQIIMPSLALCACRKKITNHSPATYKHHTSPLVGNEAVWNAPK
jgi:hypothetical protein